MRPTQFQIFVATLISVLAITLLVSSLLCSYLLTANKFTKLEEDVNDLGMMIAQREFHVDLIETVEEIMHRSETEIVRDINKVGKQIVGQSCNKDGGCGCGDSGCALTDIAQPKAINYAAEELGAKIEDVVAEPIKNYNLFHNILGLKYSVKPPINMLRSSMEPGNCFGFRNAAATITVKLAKEIFVNSFQLEHPFKDRKSDKDISTAPRDFEAFYIEAGFHATEHSFGKFVYEYRAPLQNYHVQSDTKAKYVRFKFHSNHGNPDYTCVYRIAIYGKEEK